MKPQDETRGTASPDQATRQRLAQLRSAGMHAIRFEFVVRLLRVAVKMDTMSIFWDHGAPELLEAGPVDARWRLVLGRGRRVSAEFPDHWVLGYPDDPAVKRDVEAEIDRLVETVRAQGVARTSDAQPQAAAAKPPLASQTGHGGL